jgi:hypothetical protein
MGLESTSGRLTSQVEYVEMTERKVVRMVYLADHANGYAACNELSFVHRVRFRSIPYL